MKRKVNRLWDYFRLLNWVAIFLVCLVVSLPARQILSEFDSAEAEQLELNDSESEKESKEKIKKIDSDYFLVASITISPNPFISFNPNDWKPSLLQDSFQSIFDPPPER